jgi:hypothetical protein
VLIFVLLCVRLDVWTCTGTELDRSQVELSFTLLLEAADDWQIDIPHYARELSVFIARAISDEALAPSFLTRINLGSSDLGNLVVEQASALVQHGSKNPSRMMRVWGPSSAINKPLSELQQEVTRTFVCMI